MPNGGEDLRALFKARCQSAAKCHNNGRGKRHPQRGPEISKEQAGPCSECRADGRPAGLLERMLMDLEAEPQLLFEHHLEQAVVISH